MIKYFTEVHQYTLLKKFPYSEFSRPYFPTFGLNTGKVVKFWIFAGGGFTKTEQVQTRGEGVSNFGHFARM